MCFEKSEVAEYTTSGASNFDGHRTSFFFWPRPRRKSARRLRANAICLSGLSRAFLERMDDVDRVSVFRNIEHAVFEFGAYLGLVHAGADGRHWFPVIGHQAVGRQRSTE